MELGYLSTELSSSGELRPTVTSSAAASSPMSVRFCFKNTRVRPSSEDWATASAIRSEDSDRDGGENGSRFGPSKSDDVSKRKPCLLLATATPTPTRRRVRLLRSGESQRCVHDVTNLTDCVKSWGIGRKKKMSDPAPPSPQDIVAAIAALEAQGIAVPRVLVNLRDHHAAALRRSPYTRPQGHPTTQAHPTYRPLLNNPPTPRPHLNNNNNTSSPTLSRATPSVYPPTPPRMPQRRARSLPPLNCKTHLTLSISSLPLTIFI